jgi:hypothetical protein
MGAKRQREMERDPCDCCGWLTAVRVEIPTGAYPSWWVCQRCLMTDEAPPDELTAELVRFSHEVQQGG